MTLKRPRWVWIATLGTLWVSVSAVGQAPCAFEMPVSEIKEAQFSFSYWHHDDGTTPGMDISVGQVTAQYDRIFDSPSFGHTTTFATQIDLEELLARSWMGLGSMSYRYYIASELPLFVYAGARVDIATTQPQPGFELRSGVGLGRLRDVTPLAQAQRIMDALLAHGAVLKAPSQETLLQIAESIAGRGSYAEPEDFAAAVLESVEAGVGLPLDSTAVLLLQEELEDEGHGRYCGAIFQGGVGYELIDPFGQEQDVLYVLSGDLAHAPTADSQFRCQLSWSAVSGDVFGENTGALDFSYEADLPNDSSVSAAYSVKRIASGATQPITSHLASVEFAVPMSQVDLLVSVGLMRQTGDPAWTIDLSVSFAFDLL